jgi:hypothetical protein
MMDNYLYSRGRTPEAIKEQMLQHMFDKYGVEFAVIDFEPNYNSLVSRLVVYPIGGNPETDRARVFRDRTTNDPEIRDTYFRIIIREDIEAEINAICQRLSLNSKTFGTSGASFDNKYDSTKNYEDYKNDNEYIPALLLTVVIAFEQDMDTERISDELTQAMLNERFKGSVMFYFIEREHFDALTRNNVKDILESRIVHHARHTSDFEQ